MLKFILFAFSVFAAAPVLALTADEYLTEAVRHCRTDLVTEALSASANPNYREPTTGSTPLMLAYQAHCSGSDIYLTLIKAGANVDAQNNLGATALHYAMETLTTSGCYRLSIAPLLSAKANSNLPDHNGETPLFRAIANHRMSCDIQSTIVKLLNEGNADVNVRNKAGHSVLEYALEQLEADWGFRIFAELVGKGARVSDKILYDLIASFDKRGIDYGSFEYLIGEMVSLPVTITGYKDADGRNAAHLAAEFASREKQFGIAINTKFTQVPALLNVQDKMGNTPLHIYLSEIIKLAPVGKAQADVVRAFIAAKANVNLRNAKGETTLTVAKYYGYYEIIWIIQQAGGIE